MSPELSLWGKITHKIHNWRQPAYNPKRRQFFRNSTALTLAAGSLVIGGCDGPAFYAPNISSSREQNRLKLVTGETMLLSHKSSIPWMPALIDKYWNKIVEAGEQNNLPPEFLAIIFLLESCLNPDAYNQTSGASGLGQVTAIAVADLVQNKILEAGTRPDLFDPDTNIHISAAFFSLLKQRYACGAQSANQITLLAALIRGYSAGPGKCGGSFSRLPQETRDYILLFESLWEERHLPPHQSSAAISYLTSGPVIEALRQAAAVTGVPLFEAISPETKTPVPNAPAAHSVNPGIAGIASDPAVCADGTNASVRECYSGNHGGIKKVGPIPVP